MSSRDFGSRVSCRVEKLGRDGEPLFPDPRVFETRQTLQMAIEPSVEGATVDGDKVMIRIEAFPPVHVVQVWYQCSE